MKKKIQAITVLATLAAAGVLAALALAPPAAAYTWDQLPGLGYSLSVLNLASGCHQVSAGFGSAAKTDLGSDCDTDFQSRVDAFVAATCPCAQTPTAATTTAATATDPPVTDPTTTAPTAPAQTVTDTTAAAAAVDPEIANLQAQIDALRAQVAQLVCLLQTSKTLDPGILAELLSMQTCS